MPCRLFASRPSTQRKNNLCCFVLLNPSKECYGSSLFPQKAQQAGAVLTPGLPPNVTLVTDFERGDPKLAPALKLHLPHYSH